MTRYLAWITPINMSAYPDQGLPKPQPPKPPLSIWGPGDGRPTNPIVLPLPPDAPYPDQGLPGNQPYPDQGLPGDQPKPDNTLPGAQPKPEHPIYLPPGSGAWDPVFIWGPSDPRPTPPIVIPPDVPATPDAPAIKWKAIWTESTGWVVIGIPQGPHPTPSKKK
jgi:hypothetical protein